MSKWQQEGKPGEEGRVVPKSKPMMSLVSKIANRSLTLDLSVIEKPATKGLNENTASSCQVWHQNENTSTGIGKR